MLKSVHQTVVLGEMLFPHTKTINTPKYQTKQDMQFERVGKIEYTHRPIDAGTVLLSFYYTFQCICHWI